MSRILSGALVVFLLGAPFAEAQPPLPRPKPVGVVCADPALVGVPLPSVVEENGCGMRTPIQLSAAAGVTLDPPATITCEAGRAFATWLRNGPVASFAALGQRLSAVTVLDAYSCRNRNRSAKGKLSEHAFGRAIDISGFHLGDGTMVTVGEGWTSPRWSTALRRSHEAACGTFGTVLGPDANPMHADHLHLDVASRKSGAYCR
jgi:hypothetical protein